MNKKFDVIIFDWDGTLVDSIDWIVECVQFAAKQCNIAIPEQQAAKDIIGLSLANAMRTLFPQINDETEQQLIRHYSAYFFSKKMSRTDFFNGVYEMLDTLKQAGYQLAVATGKSRAGLDRALLATDTQHLFSASRCADETASKPDPLMLDEIISDLGVDRQRVLFVGDSIHDLGMANKAKIASVGVTCGVHNSETLQKYQPLCCLENTVGLLTIL